ncbi:hypothetical protein TWF730_004390 [Orbilia blumenaviensis]|uniref:F-box domain-containing protein n=1 Tax=Orbilia blumenaviensis TaxID=1796055 RepID=A0AAV9U236_9PEZI
MDASRTPTVSFLTLPTEIRVQIYSYALPTFSSYSRCRGLFSLFSVNRQIHNETTELFYTRTKFDISIGLTKKVHPIKNDCVTYTVVYRTPWEILTYLLVVDPANDDKPIKRTWQCGDLKKADYEVMSSKQYKLHNQPWLSLFPPPHYSKLIRRLRIVVYDYSGINNGVPETPVGEGMTTEVRTIFSPFLWRLRTMLSESASVDVEIEPTWDSLKHDEKLGFAYRNIGYSNGGPPNSTYHYATEEIRRARYRRYAEALEIVYILSCGSWKTTINLPPYVEWLFPSLTEEVTAKCKKDPLFQDTTIQETIGGLGIEMDEETAWTVRKGCLYLTSLKCS